MTCWWTSIIFFPAHGDVYVWGSNSDGQLGLPDTNDNILSPVLLSFDQRIVNISCGYYHTAFVTGMFLLHIYVLYGNLRRSYKGP